MVSLNKQYFKSISLLSLLFLSFLLISCDELVSDSATCPSVFNMITVQVLNAEKQPVALDRWAVYDKNTGKELELCNSDDCTSASFSGKNETAAYLLIDDSFQGKHGKEISLIAEGKKDSIHFKEEFTVQDNGCNLVKTSGPSIIYVD